MERNRPELPEVISEEFLRELAIYFGEDPEPIENIWHWKKFIQEYPHLRPKIEEYLEKSTTGDPAWEMYVLVLNCGSSREWAEREIPKVRVGDPAIAIYHMVRFCGSPREWAEREIPKIRVGDIGFSIFSMSCLLYTSDAADE